MNLIENQPDNDKIYLYAKDLYEAKHQYLINIREKRDIGHFNNRDMHDVYKNIGEYNPDKDSE